MVENCREDIGVFIPFSILNYYGYHLSNRLKIHKHTHTPVPAMARTGWFCTTVGYGMTYGGTDVLSATELIYVMVAALVAVDAPRQVGWHLGNALRNGAVLKEVRAVHRGGR